MKDDLPRILCVDDYDDTRVLFQQVFANEPYEFDVCATGKEAITKYMNTMHCRPAAGMLMDLGLLDINGARVIRAIREIEHGSGMGCHAVRMGVISGSIGILERTTLLDDAKVSLFIAKPVEVNDLRERVREWMSAPSPCIGRGSVDIVTDGQVESVLSTRESL